ncbi:MAG: lplA [Bacteroidetes bacterium]|jgi:lipoate-protein ligase A|nr:lplA [Bacteroidota bacterium]
MYEFLFTQSNTQLMQLLDLTYPTPEENLACDEALLEMCEQGYDREILRFWEPSSIFVVLGYSNRVSTEVYPEACRTAGVPILRRYSGGGTVVQGPGCLDYALILRTGSSGPLSTIQGTNVHVMDRLRRAVDMVTGGGVEVRGHTDLAIDSLKFSGNSQRRKERFILFHGVVLLNFNLQLISPFLPHPSREPSYRKGRPHERFLRNLGVPAAAVKQSVRQEWGVEEALEDVPGDRIAELVRTRYSSSDWVHRVD